MKIVIDDKIPYLKKALQEMKYDVLAKAGDEIDNHDIADADALFVRTRTRCDARLLDGSSVRFIGTATIGYDHIDRDYCRRNGIVWKNAAGCNAGAVLQYVQSVIYERFTSVNGLSLGVVGVGEIGSRVAAWATAAGMTVYKNDPPKAAQGIDGLVSLEEIAAKCDIITFHPTLERGGDFPTLHLANKHFFESLERCALFINASRGEVVDNNALLDAVNESKVGAVALDVWENEPFINECLLEKAFVATPHIAGYSAEGKFNATRMVLDAFFEFLGERNGIKPEPLPLLDNTIEASTEREALLSIYSPLNDTSMLKGNPDEFERLRNCYKLRREPSAYKIVLK